MILGPAAGGALAALLGSAPVIWVNAASFLASALALAWIPRAFGTRNLPLSGTGTALRRIWFDIRKDCIMSGVIR